MDNQIDFFLIFFPYIFFISEKIRHLELTKSYELFIVMALKYGGVQIGLPNFVLVIFHSKIENALVIQLKLIAEGIVNFYSFHPTNNLHRTIDI